MSEGEFWKWTGNVRCRPAWRRRLVLQIEVKNGPFIEWRDAKVEDMPMVIGIGNASAKTTTQTEDQTPSQSLNPEGA